MEQFWMVNSYKEKYKFRIQRWKSYSLQNISFSFFFIDLILIDHESIFVGLPKLPYRK